MDSVVYMVIFHEVLILFGEELFGEAYFLHQDSYSSEECRA
jgi:hypothetical protein